MLIKKDSLIILAQSLEQPRIVKRIISKALEYQNIIVYGFTRNLHSVGNYKVLDDYPNVKVVLIGSLANSNYKRRIKAYFRLVSTVYRHFGFRTKNIYVFGLDLRILNVFIFNSNIHYEISDIMWLYKPKFQRTIFGGIDRLLVRFSNKVTFTSMGFYNKYYKNSIPINRVEIEENKFKTYGKVKPVVNMKLDRIRIAYIGAFRYTNIIKSLLDVAANNKAVMLNFYGDGNKNIVETMKSYSLKYTNITFNGAFRNPDDLEVIYAANNLNFVVYDNSLENEKVAMPNKYYESGFFNIPIVCAENTYVGKRVIENNMGWAIGTLPVDIESFINDLSLQDLENCHKGLKNMDKSHFYC